jgi:hypothetical protein
MFLLFRIRSTPDSDEQPDAIAQLVALPVFD